MLKKLVITTAIAAALLLSGSANATLDTGRLDGVKFLDGCPVSIGGEETCSFNCNAGDTVYVSAAGEGVAATASCGGSSSCSAPPDCENSHTAGGTMAGTCAISGESGSASCWTSCESEHCQQEPPKKCIGPYVGGKCLEDYITDGGAGCDRLRKACSGLIITSIAPPAPTAPASSTTIAGLMP